jgi:hypothetical protein
VFFKTTHILLKQKYYIVIKINLFLIAMAKKQMKKEKPKTISIIFVQEM